MKKIDKPTKVKKLYEPMKVTNVGKLNNVVEKSGGFSDNSGQWEGKSFDAGHGQEKKP